MTASDYALERYELISMLIASGFTVSALLYFFSRYRGVLLLVAIFLITAITIIVIFEHAEKKKSRPLWLSTGISLLFGLGFFILSSAESNLTEIVNPYVFAVFGYLVGLIVTFLDDYNKRN